MDFFADNLGKKLFPHWPNKEPGQSLVEQYHSHLDAKTTEILLNEYRKLDSTVRIMVATVAFGLGIDIPDIEHIIHWGPPASELCYWQEIGRCARDGRKGQAILYTPKGSKNKRYTTESLLSALSRAEEQCLRFTLLKTLQVPSISDEAIENCCFDIGCCGFCAKE